MSNYIEIVVNGTSHFVHKDAAAGCTFDVSKPNAATKLVAVSDFIIDKAGSVVKCRLSMDAVIRAYCKQAS